MRWDLDRIAHIAGRDSEVTPVCIPDRDVNSRRLDGTADGSIDLAFRAGTGARAFPEKNGIFMVKFDNPANPENQLRGSFLTGSLISRTIA